MVLRTYQYKGLVEVPCGKKRPDYRWARGYSCNNEQPWMTKEQVLALARRDKFIAVFAEEEP